MRVDTPPPLVASIDAPPWRLAHPIDFGWDFTFHRRAREQTTAYVLFDDKYLYVAAVAKQETAVIATQHTNDVGDDLDDNVAVQFWPSGATGIRYKFTSTAIGTRYEESSENDNYSPKWDAVGAIVDGGFIVVMRIPLNIMRGDGRSEWRFQIQRLKRNTGELYMWSIDPAQTDDDQGQYAGHLRGLVGLASSTRTRSRLSLYELAAVPFGSGNQYTSRIGADLAVPITATTSVLATAHPDYSNVELDQQVLQPSEFPRVLAEVRPFFSQGAHYYNRFDQVGNTTTLMLDTTLIPKPRVGTALEGNEGRAAFAGFNSVSAASTDDADVLFFSTPDKRFVTGYQRVAVSQPGFYDLAQAGTIHYDNLRNLFAYAIYGADRGTGVLKPQFGGWEEVGGGIYSPVSTLSAALKEVGKYFSPADGIVDHPNIAGYAVAATRHFDFAATSWFKFVEFAADLERYHNATTGHFHSGELNQGDNQLDVSMQSRNLYSLDVSTGSHYLLDEANVGALFDENAISLSYNVDGVTPTSIARGQGRFGFGYLRTWSEATALRAGQRGIIDLELDSTDYRPDDPTVGESRQQLQRVGFTYQISSYDSFSAGVRHVSGLPSGVGAGIDLQPGSNVSFALHHRSGNAEVYLVYGDPNAQTTYQVLTVKLIEYFGAQKGS